MQEGKTPHSSTSVMEEFAAGLYLLVLCVSIAGVGWVQITPGPYIGGAILVIGLFWLTVLFALWASFVVLALNGYRYLSDETPYWKPVTFALLTPLAIGVAIVLALVTTHFQLWVLIGGIGFLSSLGLATTVFEARARQVWTSHTR